LAVIVAVAGWSASRKQELRLNEVLLWVNASIDCIQTVVLLIGREALSLTDDERRDRLEEQGVRASVLVGQGRMFFQNAERDSFGQDKHPAFRGLRPLILDVLVVIHQLALAWPKLKTDHGAAFDVALDCLQRFVSLAQQEVGRERTASAYVAAGGSGASFASLLEEQRRTGKLIRLPVEQSPKKWLGKAPVPPRIESAIR
jgi:hypothetical protein